MTLWKKRIVLVLALMVAAPLASAGPNGRRAQRQDELREKVRALRIARLIQAVDLDATAAAQLVPILDKGYDAIGDIARESGKARRELRQLLNAPPANDARINQLIDQLVAARGRVEQVQQDMLRSVRQVLPPRQVGRLVLVLPEIEREIQQQIRRAAQGVLRRNPADLDNDIPP